MIIQVTQDIKIKLDGKQVLILNKQEAEELLRQLRLALNITEPVIPMQIMPWIQPYSPSSPFYITSINSDFTQWS